MQLILEKGLYTQFALMLEYPQENIKGLAEGCIKMLKDAPQYPPLAREEMEKFLEKVGGMSLDDLQGIYSYTCEMSADYTLELGYYLYEGFKRSANLVNLKEMYKDQGFPYDEIAKGELPDHLPVVLRFLDHVKDDELRKDFREGFVVKGLEKLKKNLEKKPDNPYSNAINALLEVVVKDVKGV
ncbi:MAG: nitrate reductase molybdenum cofactor assembly chaperone [Thermodesulfobacteriota bacterium]